MIIIFFFLENGQDLIFDLFLIRRYIVITSSFIVTKNFVTISSCKERLEECRAYATKLLFLADGKWILLFKKCIPRKRETVLRLSQEYELLQERVTSAQLAAAFKIHPLSQNSIAPPHMRNDKRLK